MYKSKAKKEAADTTPGKNTNASEKYAVESFVLVVSKPAQSSPGLRRYQWIQNACVCVAGC